MEAGGGAIGANEAAVSGRPAQPAAPTHPGLYSPSRSEGGRAGGDARWARAGRRGMGRDRTRGAGRSGVGGPKNRRWLGLMPQRKAAPRLITPRMVRPPRSLIRPDPLGPSASRRPRSYSRLETSPTGFIPPAAFAGCGMEFTPRTSRFGGPEGHAIRSYRTILSEIRKNRAGERQESVKPLASFPPLRLG